MKLGIISWIAKSLSKREVPLGIRKPRVSFQMRCDVTANQTYTGFDLLKPDATSKGSVKCTCCAGIYKVRVTKDMTAGTVIEVGRNHTLIISEINRKVTVRT